MQNQGDSAYRFLPTHIQDYMEEVKKEEVDDIDILVKSTGETFIMQDQLEETVKETTWTILVTDQAYYKLLNEGGFKRRKDLLDIHSIEADPDDPLAFTIFSYKSKTALQSNKMKGAIGLGMNFDAFLQRRHFRCSSEMARFQWVLILSRLVTDAWQRAFESSIVNAPEVYQYHTFVIKMNHKGVSQERTLVISTQWLYNVEVTHNPTVVKEKKWCLPIAALRSVNLMTEVQSPCATFFFDDVAIRQLMDQEHLGSKGTSMNDNHSFVFRDDAQRARTVRELQRILYKLTGQRLQVSQNDTPIAPDMQSSEVRGWLKKFTGMGWTVQRYCKFGPSGDIEWADSEKAKSFHRERVTQILVGEASPYKKKVSRDELPRFFTLNTTGKTLHLIAPTAEDFRKWLDGITSVLEAMSQE